MLAAGLALLLALLVSAHPLPRGEISTAIPFDISDPAQNDGVPSLATCDPSRAYTKEERFVALGQGDFGRATACGRLVRIKNLRTGAVVVAPVLDSWRALRWGELGVSGGVWDELVGGEWGVADVAWHYVDE